MLPQLPSPLLPLPHDLLASHGHAQWSARILDPDGHGVVLTWGFGQPLTRLQESGEARGLPSLSLLIFSRDQPAFWLHQRHPPAEGSWEEPAGRWRFGASQIEAFRDLKAQVVIARLDCEIPGSRHRLTGHIEMGGVPRRLEAGRSSAAAHAPHAADDWSPLMGYGEGRAILQAGPGCHFHLQGRASHERFGCAAPFAAPQGIEVRGHVPFADRDVSFWARLDAQGRGEALGAAVDTEGRSEAVLGLRAEAEAFPKTGAVLTLYRGDQKWLEAQVEHVPHAREVEGHAILRARAPMALPAAGLCEWTAPRKDVPSAARRFVHLAGTRAPRAVRLACGPTRQRWRRGLPFA